VRRDRSGPEPVGRGAPSLPRAAWRGGAHGFSPIAWWRGPAALRAAAAAPRRGAPRGSWRRRPFRRHRSSERPRWGRSVTLCEEGGFQDRGEDHSRSVPPVVGAVVTRLIRRTMRPYAAGMARHSLREVGVIARRDLDALAVCLGAKLLLWPRADQLRCDGGCLPGERATRSGTPRGGDGHPLHGQPGRLLRSHVGRLLSGQEATRVGEGSRRGQDQCAAHFPRRQFDQTTRAMIPSSSQRASSAVACRAPSSGGRSWTAAPCLDGAVRALCAPREPRRWGQGARVSVGPPLFVRGPSFGSWPVMSAEPPTNAQAAVFSIRLWP